MAKGQAPPSPLVMKPDHAHIIGCPQAGALYFIFSKALSSIPLKGFLTFSAINFPKCRL
ncbi:hypothetical protein J6590_056609 [Homalodisca vitripennis]|nr:hypothetical protein J6590_056609 [Homalodisca vitripennis]